MEAKPLGACFLSEKNDNNVSNNGIAAPILESISNPSGGAGWSWVGCGCQKDLISDQIPTCLVPRIGGIKLQLLCGVRIEPA